jgi:hypothetical protein
MANITQQTEKELFNPGQKVILGGVYIEIDMQSKEIKGSQIKIEKGKRFAPTRHVGNKWKLAMK